MELNEQRIQSVTQSPDACREMQRGWWAGGTETHGRRIMSVPVFVRSDATVEALFVNRTSVGPAGRREYGPLRQGSDLIPVEAGRPAPAQNDPNGMEENGTERADAVDPLSGLIRAGFSVRVLERRPVRSNAGVGESVLPEPCCPSSYTSAPASPSVDVWKFKPVDVASRV